MTRPPSSRKGLPRLRLTPACEVAASLGRISVVPTPYPKEFRRDVIAVARQGDQSVAQVARSFGISESCLARWLRIAERENDGAAPLAPRRQLLVNSRQRTASCAGGPSSSNRRTRSCAAPRLLRPRRLPKMMFRWSVTLPPTASTSRCSAARELPTGRGSGRRRQASYLLDDAARDDGQEAVTERSLQIQPRRRQPGRRQPGLPRDAFMGCDDYRLNRRSACN